MGIDRQEELESMYGSVEEGLAHEQGTFAFELRCCFCGKLINQRPTPVLHELLTKLKVPFCSQSCLTDYLGRD